MRWLRRAVFVLYEQLRHLIEDAWLERKNGPNPVTDYFGPNIRGMIDSYPIRVRRPKNRVLQRALYQGKYKCCVLKFQLMARFDGLPIFVSGPHIGVRPDVDLWREYGPDVPDDEIYMGDKGYQGGGPRMNSPTKKSRGRELDQDQQDLNRIHSWFRGGIEHVIGQVKKFNVISGKYRGNLMQDNGLLQALNGICVALVILQVRQTPLRVHEPLLDSDDEEEAMDAVAARRREELENLPFDHNLLGDPYVDLQQDDEGHIFGHGDEPDNDDINTFCSIDDFSAGQAVWAWFWGRFYRATIQRVALRQRTLQIRWNWSHSVTSGYEPRLVIPRL
jgi:hypothetical protein